MDSQMTSTLREAGVARPYDPKEQLRKMLLRNVLRLTQQELARQWGTSQALVGRLLAACGAHSETRSLRRELDFVDRVNKKSGSQYEHHDLWPPHRDYQCGR